MIEFGTSSIPNIATTNTVPQKRTARLAVAPEAAIAPCSLLPLAALLAVARDDEQRVVDPEREAHPREHVHEEDRELELLGEEGAEPERDDDRDDRHQQRHEPGDNRPEDEEEDDERRREAELELAVLQVLLRQEVEVVVERLRAGHRHDERRRLVDAPRPSRRAPPSRRRRRARSG